MRSVTALVYLTLFAPIAAFLCYNYALTRIPAPLAVAFINAIPLVKGDRESLETFMKIRAVSALS